jgi:hypothetical protein
MIRMMPRIVCLVGCLLASPIFAADLPVEMVDLVDAACVDCHNGADQTAGLDLEQLVGQPFTAHRQTWEKVAKKLRSGQMPPAGAFRPESAPLAAAIETLEASLDTIAIENPHAGRVDSFRRMTRFEYANAIRDLLALKIDVDSLLPADEVSRGFDNITVNELSPTLLSRYVTAAQKISRLAIGAPSKSPGGQTYRVPPDVTQDVHLEGLPLGTRGGMLIQHTFPQNGEYEITVRLTRDRDEHVEGLHESHEIEFLVDRRCVERLTVRPPRGKADPEDPWSKPTHEHVDRHLTIRLPVTAGPHQVGVTFLNKGESLLESKRQPLNVHFNMYRHPRLGPAVYQVSITGPYDADGPGETPSRQQIFVRYPQNDEEQEACAREIIAHLLRRATRGPVSDEDLANPIRLYREASQRDGFEAGIEMALSAILIHPRFLFRIEKDPTDIASGTVYPISDLELASRLSFFLWSSLPDSELLAVAEQGRLRDPQVLESQVRRMLADPRSHAMVTSFAGQWLYLRNLDSITPDGRLYPDFDDNLRQAFRRETELFVESVFREDRSVVDLLKSDYTYLNERLARHYGIPHVYGSRFRRVELDPSDHRGGLLRHGSILTVTSYATRTSPVIRGKWILENMLGTPPPPPPPNVPDLVDNVVSANLPVRERLAQHRADPACASCHNLIDPIGFALENYDAVGRWRLLEQGQPVDAAGGLPDGRKLVGVDELEQGLVEQPRMFVETVTEKLLTYALGRGVEYYDAPAIRQIVREAASDDYRFSSIVLGIVQSTPFQMKTAK